MAGVLVGLRRFRASTRAGTLYVPSAMRCLMSVTFSSRTPGALATRSRVAASVLAFVERVTESVRLPAWAWASAAAERPTSAFWRYVRAASWAASLSMCMRCDVTLLVFGGFGYTGTELLSTAVPIYTYYRPLPCGSVEVLHHLIAIR